MAYEEYVKTGSQIIYVIVHNIDPTDIDGFQSSRMHISTGVPQGSILGPVLFLVYIYDIYKCSTINLLCLADDITAYLSGPNVKELITEVNVQLKNCTIGFVVINSH